MVDNIFLMICNKDVFVIIMYLRDIYVVYLE